MSTYRVVNQGFRPPNLGLFAARAKCFLWDIGTKLILAILSVAVSSEGLRCLNPEFGQKLYKLPIPGAYLLEDDDVGHRVDIAHALALILVVIVFVFWARVLRNWLWPVPPVEDGRHHRNYHTLTNGIAGVILFTDAALFYYGSAQMDWSGGGFSLTTLFASVSYIAVVVAVSFVSVELHQKVTSISREDSP